MPAVGTRPLDQVVLEHERCDDLRSREVHRGQQPFAVDVLAKGRTGDVDLAVGRLREQAHRLRHAPGGVVGAEFRGDDRKPLVEPHQQPGELLGGKEAAVQDETGQRGKTLGGMRVHHRQHDVGTVTGHHDRRTFRQPEEDVVDRHGTDDGRLRFPLQEFGIPAEEPAVHGVHQVGESGRGEKGDVRHDPGRHRLIGQGVADLIEASGLGPVHHDRHHLGVLRAEFRSGDIDGLAHLETRALEPGAHQNHGGADVGGDARVV